VFLTNKQFRAVSVAEAGRPSATSNVVGLTVHTKISLKLAHLSGCRVRFTGSTLPTKANRRISIQRHRAAGWRTAYHARTHSNGKYRVRHRLTCGKTYRFRSVIAGDSVNASGRSASHRVKARRH
jgi:chloramphenicol 3-O-phosphotransferase